jgi:hypothetical protein
MSRATHQTNHMPLIVLGLAMALGPLTALSLGSRYADEETFARAQAGAENIKRREMQATIANPPAERAETAQAYADAMTTANDSES